jgi:hypothetical protein
MILRNRLPFLCNVAATTCSQMQNLSFHWSGLCRKMSKVMTPSVYTDSHVGAIPVPPLRHAHDAVAARDDSGGQKRDYAWLSRDVL